MNRNFSTKNSLLFAVVIALIFICYFYVDKPAAEISYYHNWQRFTFFKWLTCFSAIIVTLSFLSVVYSTIKRCRLISLSNFESILFVASLNTLITAEINQELKVFFGRTWPATWTNNNPSWINNHIYGFNFFHGAQAAYKSFPSGHTAVAFAMISVLWIALPRWRWLFILIGVGVGTGLIAMHHHFVSDVIAGGLLGTITGILATRAFLTTNQHRQAH